MASSDTQFKDGNEGGPGRPKGSRNKLSEGFLGALSDHFDEHGVEAIEKLYAGGAAQYCNVIGKLMPKLMELSGPEGNPIEMAWTVEVIESDADDPSPE